MKLASKPVSSSPRRPDKFPPPLTTSLRSSTNGRSRSRRTRPSPMFRRKSIDALEPGSPKVTCIGQIRIRKSNQSGVSHRRQRRQRRHCCCLKAALFSPPKRPNWRSFFSSLLLKRVRVREYSPNGKGLNPVEGAGDGCRESEGEEASEAERESRGFVAVSPPKNALLLMRCRSEPNRTSEVANRFWGSPAGGGEGREKEREEEEQEDKREEGRRRSESDRRMEARIEQMGISGPLILTRCRSEPARLRKPDPSFWTGKNLRFPDA